MAYTNSPRLQKGIVFLFCIFCSVTLKAQLTIDAQYRTRGEMRQGYQKLAADGADAAIFISQRTRLSVTWETDGLLLRFSPQDVRVWGDEQSSSTTGVFGDDASLDLFEAYTAIRTGSHSSLTVGRQQLVYDHQRLLAARNWNQNGLSYDAFLFKWEPSVWSVHAAVSWNSTGENTSDNNYDPDRIKTLAFVWINYNPDKNATVSISHLASGQTKSDTENKQYFRQTTGVYSRLKQGDWSLVGNIYYQFGKNQSGSDVSAVLFDLETQYQCGPLTPGIGASYLSGNKHQGTEQGTDHLFDVLYGARHGFFGGMDYFRSFSSNTKDAGLAAGYAFLDWKISPKTSLKNTAWSFWLAQTNEQTPDQKTLGFENDLVLKHKFSDWGTIESGYLFFVPDKTLKTIQSVPDNRFSHFFYLQLSITPQLFNGINFKQKI